MSTHPLVSGFTMVKNALTLGYPIKESIESIEPLCDEIVINVGHDDPSGQDDGTYAYLRDHFQHPKFIFLRNRWDPGLTQKGEILAQQTNLALQACRGKYAHYIQGDEVVHEEDLPVIHDHILGMEQNPQIDGLVFNYIHFYGNTNIIKHTRSIYRREVRVIRNHRGFVSWLDAQGFRRPDGSKPLCQIIPARIFHYGWARKENIMAEKVKVMDRLYHGPDHHQAEEFIYRRLWGLRPFKGTHPSVMRQWIESHRNDMDIMTLKRHFQWQDLGLALADGVEALTGYRIGEFKNYKLL